MQEFFINKGSTLPLLKMELVNNGVSDNDIFYDLLQSGTTITFSMENADTGTIKISNKQAIILPKETCCSDESLICYAWEERDTKDRGKYKGKFTLTFPDSKKLIVPIQEELIIYIQ